MLEKHLKEKLITHLSDALKPIPETELGEAAILVEFPTKTAKSPGGLSQQGKILGQLDADIAAADKSHKEQTRVKIKAVRATCALFAASKTRALAPEEMKALKEGIVVNNNGKLDKIKTTRKNGTALTDEFKLMMADLYKAVKTTLPETVLILKKAAEAQKREENKEREASQNIPEMA
mgnify:CR=1 FL=1